MTYISDSIGDSQLSEDLGSVRAVINGYIQNTPEMIRSAVERLLADGGKMLRPAMVVLAGRYGDFDGNRIYSLAAAVEMLHNATLVHDDIIDEAETRRGKPAMHTIHGSKLAILLGDYMFSGCFVMASRNSRIDQYDKLAKAVARVCEGEILQDTEKFIFNPSIRKYKRRIASKTAVLFSLSLYLGAKEAGCPEADCNIFVRIGYNIGMAFQVIDDILDFNGKTDKVGKPVTGHDMQEGIFTLPAIIAMQSDSGELAKLFSEPPYSPESIAKALTIINQSGAIEKAKAVAELYSQRARREIARLEPGYTSQQLEKITGQLLSRNF